MDIITYGLLKKKIMQKADIDSPHFTGIPTAPTAPDGTDTDQIATTAFVQSAIADIPGGTDTKYTLTRDHYTVILTGTDSTVQEITLPIYYDTKERWATKTTLVSEMGALYVYSNYQQHEGVDIPGIKIGDGLAFVVDLPFIDEIYREHILNTYIHVTQAEKEFWNNKVTCFIDPNKADKLVFSKD